MEYSLYFLILLYFAAVDISKSYSLLYYNIKQKDSSLHSLLLDGLFSI